MSVMPSLTSSVLAQGFQSSLWETSEGAKPQPAAPPFCMTYPELLFNLAGVSLRIQFVHVIIQRPHLGSRDRGVATKTGFQDGVMDKHILFLEKQRGLVRNRETRWVRRTREGKTAPCRQDNGTVVRPGQSTPATAKPGVRTCPLRGGGPTTSSADAHVGQPARILTGHGWRDRRKRHTNSMQKHETEWLKPLRHW